MRITILTKACPFDSYHSFLKRIFFHPAGLLKIVKAQKEIHGHTAVTKSILRGLKASGIKFNYNPLFSNRVAKTVVILSDVEALRQCIRLKQHKHNMKILAGPNLMIWSNEYGGILAHPAIDIILVPSEWVKTAYIEDNKYIDYKKIKTWPAGVDTGYWATENVVNRAKVLIYYKNCPKGLLRLVEEIILKANMTSVVIRYGKYKEDKYKKLLMDSSVAVFLSQSESQGIALAEAWAMNVPTLVWDPEKLTYKGRVYSSVSAAPYLTKYTGIKWKETADLKIIFDRINSGSLNFSPREWVLNHMSDSISANKLVQIIEEIPN